MPKDIDIEALVRWAFVEELPKDGGRERHRAPGYASAWSGILQCGELMALVDAQPNHWGVVPAGGGDDPHPDAIEVGRAVAALDGLDVGLPEGWSPFADMAGLGLGPEGDRLLAQAAARAYERVSAPAGEGIGRALGLSPAELVRRCAVLGRAPDWEAEPPALRSVRGERGRERWFRRVTINVAAGGTYDVEIDGYDARRRRPHPDAYRRFTLDPDPLDAAIARAEYEVWHAALGWLVAALDGRLTERRATGPAAPERPWEVDCGG